MDFSVKHNEMLIRLLTAVTSLFGTYIAINFTVDLLKVLPVGLDYFAATVIGGLTYGEVVSALLSLLSFAFFIGLAHGYFFRKADVKAVPVFACLPLLTLIFAVAAATLGAALITLPVVFIYAMTVRYGVHKGARLKKGADIQVS